MENLIKLNKLFCRTLNINESQISDSLEYNTIPEWDSIGHMKIIAAIEEDFDIMLDTDEIINLSTFKIAKDILIAHGIKF